MFSTAISLVNGVQFVGHPVQSALRFDGVDDQVDLPAAVLDGLDEFSVSVWLKSASQTDQIYMSGSNGSDGNEF